MKGGPVYEVGSSINRVYNPCRVIRQNAALSGCNRFFSNKAAVGNIFKRYKEIVWTFWITITSLKLKCSSWSEIWVFIPSVIACEKMRKTGKHKLHLTKLLLKFMMSENSTNGEEKMLFSYPSLEFSILNNEVFILNSKPSPSFG